MTVQPEAKQTPMMQQFYQIKQQHPDKILFYRMGDFYEMFGDDAVIAAKVLQIQLTTRNKNKDDSIPLCGVPIHAYDQYLNKLTQAGYKVAVCEQTEDPALAKGLVKREVVRIITPGTIVSPELLDANDNCFLAGLSFDLKKNRIGLAFCDLSTGEFETDQLDIRKGVGEVLELIYLYKPREILIAESDSHRETGIESELIAQIKQMFQPPAECRLEATPDMNFEPAAARRCLKEQFGVSTLAGFGIDDKPSSIQACGAVLAYLKETQKDMLRHISRIRLIQKDERMTLDESTIRNLELFETLTGLDKKHTLISLLDTCKTAMGSRKLRRWLAAPLLKKEAIEERLDAVQAFLDSGTALEKSRLVMSRIGDLERIVARISMPNTSVTDLVRLRSGLEPLESLKGELQQIHGSTLQKRMTDFDSLDDLYHFLAEQIKDEPSSKMKEGGFIREGVNEELDKLNHLTRNGKQLIANMEASERQKTGITSLKIRFNKVFGYYIDISNTSKHLVPDSYIRRQTLVNSERYVTEELKELEEDILSAETESKELELRLFNEIKDKLLTDIHRIQKTAETIATIDVLSTFAFNAKLNNYTRPILDDNPNQKRLSIQEGRHPVIESLDFEEPFIPNDVLLDSKAGAILVITGPNMGGKSTYMRQTALIALMAQAGSFVPAQKAEIPMFDRIFTRVGASDNLTRGQSTFMVEMSEAASILNNATENSFIILDEIGRGTSTFDGISIAWAMIEFLHQIKALTLFATHYHELILLEQQLDAVSNAKVVVHEEDDTMVFLRKIVPGETDKSYGIQVAKLAGLPQTVVDRAKEVMAGLKMAEKQFSALEGPLAGEKRAETKIPENRVEENLQISFMPPEEPWMEDVRRFDVNKRTPLEALELIHRIQKNL